MTLDSSGILTSGAHPASSGHVVQFYDKEEYLYAVVADFLAEALAAHEPIVVIATAEHRAGFERELNRKGFPLGNGHAHLVTLLDARATLELFMRGSMPDRELFQLHIGGTLSQCLAGWPRVRAYGEMVDLLWRDGNPEAAVRLEELWNELAGLYPFSLLCAYPMGNFFKSSHAPYFERVCGAHGKAIPTEQIRGAYDDAQLREIALLQQRAEALSAEVEHRKELQQALTEALEQRRLDEAELRRLYGQAQEANRAKDQFLATLSHELRTPLTAICGWAHMLKMGGMDQTTVDAALDTIERSARAQNALIDDLLDVSRIVTGKLSLNREPVDLVAVVGNAVQAVQLAADARGIRLEVDAGKERLVVSGDATRLQQIVWNLLSNAIKFCEPDSAVTLTIERLGSEARIRVCDQGRGIAPGFLPYVFEPFRQADSGHRRLHGGLGLGLAIVKYLAELHGGSVSAESGGEGRGATFSVTLPLATRRLLASREEREESLPDLHGTSVLLVEDDADSRGILAAILARAGADVISVSSVAQACEALQARAPHVVLTDIAMPGTDGFSLIEHVRRMETPVRVVAVTALTDREARERLQAEGIQHIRKPVDPMELLRAVRECAVR